MPEQIDGEGMRFLARAISKLAPGLGFTLLTFEFERPGIANYISNADRADMIRGLEETLERLKSGQDFPTPNNN